MPPADVVNGVLNTLGGLGLFLWGMSTMTGALRALADERLRNVLVRYVNSPGRGVITGAIATALLQSSSATTVAAVGFVGAKILTFPESLGIIFGANIGTTITGWIVALVGFKLNLGQAMLPLIFLGVLCKLTERPRLQQLGMGLAGFGLIFLGLALLQQGLGGIGEFLTPRQFPQDGWLSRLVLLLLGAVITVITQSSSAGVAMALAAVHTGTIPMTQAAAMVIGMDLGTTSTAAMATLGGDVQAKRTGFAHVIYNSLTAVGAFCLLSPYLRAVDYLWPGATVQEPEAVLVGFHTFFNALGVVAILPFTRVFASLIVRLFPDRGNILTRRLDRSLWKDPLTALRAVQGTLSDITQAVLDQLQAQLNRPRSDGSLASLRVIQEALEQTGEYLQQLAPRFQTVPQFGDYLAAVHILDHLRRLERRLHDHRRILQCRNDDELSAMTDRLVESIQQLRGSARLDQGVAAAVRSINRELKLSMRRYRQRVARRTADGSLTTAAALRNMDTCRWLRRVAYHLWRIAFHSAGSLSQRRAAGTAKADVADQVSP